MRTINIGRLNKRVTFMKLTEEKDKMGQLKQVLTEVGTVWASFYPIRGAEFYEAQKVQSKITHKCYIRYRSYTLELKEYRETATTSNRHTKAASSKVHTWKKGDTWQKLTKKTLGSSKTWKSVRKRNLDVIKKTKKKYPKKKESDALIGYKVVIKA